MERRRLRIGEWEVSPELNTLERSGRSVDIEPLAMDLLVFLAARAGEVLSTEELIAAVWKGRVVGDHSVYRLVQQLRRALGDDSRDPTHIVTVPRRGYRLIAPVELHAGSSSFGPASMLIKRIPALHRQYRAATGILALMLAAALLIAYRTGPGTGSVDGQTIAVLPFVNLGTDESNDYLGEGIAGEILHALSSVPDLRLIARTSSFQFADNSVGVTEIAERLGATAILEGSVRRDDNRLRVIAQLVDAEDGTSVWSDDFDGDRSQ